MYLSEDVGCQLTLLSVVVSTLPQTQDLQDAKVLPHTWSHHSLPHFRKVLASTLLHKPAGCSGPASPCGSGSLHPKHTAQLHWPFLPPLPTDPHLSSMCWEGPHRAHPSTSHLRLPATSDVTSGKGNSIPIPLSAAHLISLHNHALSFPIFPCVQKAGVWGTGSILASCHVDHMEAQTGGGRAHPARSAQDSPLQ